MSFEQAGDDPPDQKAKASLRDVKKAIQRAIVPQPPTWTRYTGPSRRSLRVEPHEDQETKVSFVVVLLKPRVVCSSSPRVHDAEVRGCH